MMDTTTTLEELKQKVKLFCEERDWDQFHNPKDLSVGLMLEAAELLEPFRFKSERDMMELFADPQKKNEISEEAANVLFYLLRLSQMYDIDLAKAFKEKMEKNGQKYPVERSKGQNRKYNEL